MARKIYHATKGFITVGNTDVEVEQKVQKLKFKYKDADQVFGKAEVVKLIEENEELKVNVQRNLSDEERSTLRDKLDLFLEKAIEVSPETAPAVLRGLQTSVAELSEFDAKIKFIDDETKALEA